MTRPLLRASLHRGYAAQLLKASGRVLVPGRNHFFVPSMRGVFGGSPLRLSGILFVHMIPSRSFLAHTFGNINQSAEPIQDTHG